MIDKTLIRQGMRIALLTKANQSGSGFPPQASGYAWENANFNPPNDGSMWIRETLLPIRESQTSNDLIQFDGWMQYDVFVQKGSGSQKAEKVAKAIGDVFKPASSLTDPIKIHIMGSEPLPGSISDDWWMSPVRVRVLAYGQRG